MLLEQQKKTLGPIEAVKEAQKLYAICFNEILRQVYVSCTERGQLLEKIWTRYLQLFDHVLKIRERERAQYNQKLQQQMMMYQQLYQDKDEAFNNVYLQLATEKEKLQMAKDKLERAVLLLREDFKRRNRKEAKMKKVIAHLKLKARDASDGATATAATEEEFSEDELLLPVDIGDDCFSASNLLIVQRLQFIEERLRSMKEAIPQDQVDANFGAMLELDSLLGTLSDTISSLSESVSASATDQLPIEFRRQSTGAAASTASTSASTNHLDKTSQTMAVDVRIGSLPSSLLEFWSFSFKVPKEIVHDKAWVITHINAIYAHKILVDEAYDSANRKRVPLIEVLYNFFVSLYGIRSVAENRIADLFASAEAIAGRCPRSALFLKLCNAFTTEDASFFLYTLAQFYEGSESEVTLHDTADGTQWITMECAKLMIDSTFRDQEQDFRDDLVRACETASLQGRVDLDLFLMAMVERCHALGASPEEQLSLLYTSSFSSTSTSTAAAVLTYSEFAALMRSFGGSDMPEHKLQKMYRHAVDDFEQESRRPQQQQMQQQSPMRGMLPSIVKVARKQGLLSWKAFPPTKVDKKKVCQAVFAMLSLLWTNTLPEVQRLVASLTTLASSLDSPAEVTQIKQAIAELQDTFTRHLEIKENDHATIEAFRQLNEQLHSGRAIERKLSQS